MVTFLTVAAKYSSGKTSVKNRFDPSLLKWLLPKQHSFGTVITTCEAEGKDIWATACKPHIGHESLSIAVPRAICPGRGDRDYSIVIVSLFDSQVLEPMPGTFMISSALENGPCSSRY